MGCPHPILGQDLEQTDRQPLLSASLAAQLLYLKEERKHTFFLALLLFFLLLFFLRVGRESGTSWENCLVLQAPLGRSSGKTFLTSSP